MKNGAMLNGARKSYLKIFGMSICRSFWTELDLPTNPIFVSKLTQQKGGHRERSEGLALGCSSKGRKEGTGSKVLKLMLVIGYGKGVTICEPYEKMSGAYFSNFIDRNFNTMFQTADKGNSPIWVKEGDPSQNSALAKSAMPWADSILLRLPPQSPDFHPIENLFHIASNKLKAQAVSQNKTIVF